MREKKKLQMISQDLWDEEEPKTEAHKDTGCGLTDKDRQSPSLPPAEIHNLQSTIDPNPNPVPAEGALFTATAATSAVVTSSSPVALAPIMHHHPRAPERRSGAATLALTIARSPWNLTATAPSPSGTYYWLTGGDHFSATKQAVSVLNAAMTSSDASINQCTGTGLIQDDREQVMITMLSLLR
jgi:hypothetical protein